MKPIFRFSVCLDEKMNAEKCDVECNRDKRGCHVATAYNKHMTQIASQ